MKIEHGFRDWKTHLRLRNTLHAQNVAFVKGLLTVLALLYWFTRSVVSTGIIPVSVHASPVGDVPVFSKLRSIC